MLFVTQLSPDLLVLKGKVIVQNYFFQKRRVGVMKAFSSSQKEDVFQSDIQWQILAALFISSIIFFDYVIMELYICWQ